MKLQPSLAKTRQKRSGRLWKSVREPHSIQEKPHILDSNRRTVEWFTRRLLD